MITSPTFESLLTIKQEYPFSVKFFLSEACVEQFRFPRTKKRRIRNKWSKRPENWRPARRAYQMTNGDLIVHPKMYDLVRRQIATPPEIQHAISRNLFDLM